MKRHLILLFILLLGSASAHPPQALPNDSISKMVAADLEKDVTLSDVKSQPANFDLSPEGRAGLKRAGASDKIVAVMREKGNVTTAAARTAPQSDSRSSTEGQDASAPAPARAPSKYTIVQLKRQDELTRRIQGRRAKAAKKAKDKKIVEPPWNMRSDVCIMRRDVSVKGVRK
jgi:hypothetical protein